MGSLVFCADCHTCQETTLICRLTLFCSFLSLSLQNLLIILSDMHTPGQFWKIFQFSSVQSLSHVRLFATPWIAARQASLSIAKSRSPLKLMPIELVMPSSHLILCCPLLLLHPIPPSIRVFSNESALRMRWPKYWSFSFSNSPSNKHPGLRFPKLYWLCHQNMKLLLIVLHDNFLKIQ